MANPQWSDGTNVVPCLDKFEGNAEFHDVIDLLLASSFRYSLVTSPAIYKHPLEQYWSSAHPGANASTIEATVCGHHVVLSAKVIREALKLDDAGGAMNFADSEIQSTLRTIGYARSFNADGTTGTIFKKDFAPRWRFLIEVILKCLSRKTTGWDQISYKLQYILHSVVTGQKFNFSRFLLENLAESLDEASRMKRVAIYPRFLTIIFKYILKEKYESSGSIFPLRNQSRKTFSNMRIHYLHGTGPPISKAIRRLISNPLPSSPSPSESFQNGKAASSHSSSDGGEDSSPSRPIEPTLPAQPSVSTVAETKPPQTHSRAVKRRRLVCLDDRHSPPSPGIEPLESVNQVTQGVVPSSLVVGSTTADEVTQVSSQQVPVPKSGETLLHHGAGSFELVTANPSSPRFPLSPSARAIHKSISKMELGPPVDQLKSDMVSPTTLQDTTLRSPIQGESIQAPESQEPGVTLEAPTEVATIDHQSKGQDLTGTKAISVPTENEELSSESGSSLAPEIEGDQDYSSSQPDSTRVSNDFADSIFSRLDSLDASISNVLTDLSEMRSQINRMEATQSQLLQLLQNLPQSSISSDPVVSMRPKTGHLAWKICSLYP